MTDYFPFIRPDISHRQAVCYTKRNPLGDHVLSTRKMLNVFHEITYSFDALGSRHRRIIEDNFKSLDGGKTSLYVVHWDDPKLVKGISGADVTLNNVSDLSANVGDGGNRVILWENSGDYGTDSDTSGSVLTDTSKSWTTNEWANHKLLDTNGTEFSISSNTATTITVASGSPAPGAYDIYRYESFTISSIAGRVLTLSGSPTMSYSAGYQFLMPVYTCWHAEDRLGLAPTGKYCLEIGDDYGPLYSGEILFTQKGTG